MEKSISDERKPLISNEIFNIWGIGIITDTIVFPGDNGIPVVNLQYKDVNTGETKVVSHGVFLNEERLFGVCTEIPNESSTTDTKSTS